MSLKTDSPERLITIWIFFFKYSLNNMFHELQGFLIQIVRNDFPFSGFVHVILYENIIEHENTRVHLIRMLLTLGRYLRKLMRQHDRPNTDIQK